MATKKKVGQSPTAREPDPHALSMSDLGVADLVDSAELPRLGPLPPALLTFHRERWFVARSSTGGAVVPLLGRMPIVGGLGNVRVIDKHGRLSISAAVAEKTRRGWTVLPLDIDGPNTSYLYTPDGCPQTYLTRWETAHAGSTVITTDSVGYVDWLVELLAAGRLPRPKRYVLERIRSELRQQVLELQDRVRTVPSVGPDLERTQSDLAVVERELERQVPRPVRGRAAVALPGVDDSPPSDGSDDPPSGDSPPEIP